MDKNYHSDSPQDGRRATADGSPRPTPKPAQPGNGFKSAEGTALLSSPQPPRPRQPANPYELEYAETAPLSALETWLKPDPGEEPTKRLEDGEEAAQFSRVGKYEYLGEIARGGMGRIVLVRDRLLRRRVAMKLLISPDGKPSKHTIDRFLAEAQVTGQLEHPNIVPIHDVGTYQDNSHYFTMKLVKGTTLSAAFRKLAEGDEQYSLPRLLAVFQQIANGLSFAHARGVIHRDLKPDNIMLGEFGEVLIMDWGLAKLKHAPPPSANGAGTPGGRKTTALFGTLDTQDVEGTVAGTVAGTPGYMSPEQARGEIDRLDGRADIFALGAMLYEALAGSPPYNQRGVTARVRAAAKEEPIEPPAARLRKTNPQRAARIPREVAAIAMKALSPKPEDRYSTAREFGEDIQRYLEGRSVLACPDTPAQRAVKWVRRNRVMVGAVAAVVCAVIVAAVGARLLIHYSNISRFTREARQIVAAAAAERGRQMQLIPAVDKANDPYAGFIEQRAMDSIDEKYTQQLAQAAEYYTRVFDYDPANQTARAELAKLYMEMWRAAARRNQPELMAAHAQSVAYYAGAKDYQALYQKELDGDGKLALSAGEVKAEVYIFRYVETGRWNRLTPVPYRLAERRYDDAALEEASANLRMAADGRDGRSVYHLSFNPEYGHLLGTTPLRLDPMPVGSYLLVLRAPGYEDLRLPVALQRQKELELNVKMLKIGERPKGFTYIPSVVAKVGGPSAGTQWPNFTWKALGAFFIQTHEITFGEYEEYLKGLIAEGRISEAAEHLPKDFGFKYLEIVGKEIKPHASLTEGWRKWPVRGVSWLDAQHYIAWRSRRDRVVYRLPSELEWEVAARGVDGRRYTWGEVFWPQAARLSQGYGGLSNLQADQMRRNGQFADESPFGVWDMAGSQAEWCADLFGGRDEERVLRGNAWALQPVGLEAAFRTSGPQDYFHSTTGFRLAMDAR